jgi:LysR family glycine cleavage system transcriptional activator
MPERPSPLPPLAAIRVFEAAARLKSFTRAAEELGMTQAAVSYQVKELEARLGTPMFRRLPREVELTAAGERLSRAASEATSLLRAAVADIMETTEGVLSVTTLPSFAALWLAPRIGAFQVAHPKIAVRLDTTGRMVDLTREGMDVGIRTGHGEWPGVTADFLFPDVFLPLCSPAYLTHCGAMQGPEDLERCTLIGSPTEWARWFAAAGVPGRDAAPRTAFYADTQQFEVSSAMSGQGFALGSPILFAADIAAGRLIAPFDVPVAFAGGYWLAYAEGRRRSPKIGALRNWLLEQARSDPAVARYSATTTIPLPSYRGHRAEQP